MAFFKRKERKYKFDIVLTLQDDDDAHIRMSYKGPDSKTDFVLSYQDVEDIGQLLGEMILRAERNAC